MRTVLLHLIGTAGWRAALATGAVDPLPDVGFVHLSAPEQVARPANRIFAGRRDLLLLVLDPGRLGVEVRWEPGVHGDPASMRFPHAYGPVPAAAVLAVEPYRPGPDGVFTAPALPDPDVANRCLRAESSLSRRTAAAEVPVTGGVAVRTPDLADSRLLNQLLVDGTTDAATVAAEADAVLGGGPHRMATLFGEGHRATAVALADLGWEVEEFAVMTAAPAGTPSGRVEHVDVEALRPSWPDTVADRYLLQEAVVDVRYLGLRVHGEVVASAVLSLDGATAWLDGVATGTAHRGRGYADAVVAEALAVAAGAGCDALALGALTGGWLGYWYGRRGFVEVGRCWSATRV